MKFFTVNVMWVFLYRSSCELYNRPLISPLSSLRSRINANFILFHRHYDSADYIMYICHAEGKFTYVHITGKNKWHAILHLPPVCIFSRTSFCGIKMPLITSEMHKKSCTHTYTNKLLPVLHLSEVTDSNE